MSRLVFRSRPRFILVAALALTSAHCTSSGESPSSDRGSSTAGTVGATGGTIASPNGMVKLEIPPGALDGDVLISINPVAAPIAGGVGQAFDFSPSGTTFKTPVAITLGYAGAQLGGEPASKLRVAVVDDGRWSPLDGYALDEGAKTVRGTTTHFCIYGLSVSRLCVDVQGGTPCFASGGSSNGDDAGPGDPPTVTCAPELTCTNAATTVCSSYPGASMTACTDQPPSDQGGSRFSATCCFPEGEPVCVRIASPTCVDSSGGGGSCPPPPKCADNPCGARPTTTMKECVDTTQGFDATCCYPAGIVPPEAPSPPPSSGAGHAEPAPEPAPPGP